MKPNHNQTLWERIQNFAIDDPAAPFKFSDKLAKEAAWTPAFTVRAVEEYKRFIFLCCVSPTGASPSPVVDEVWHLHLTYTENYWKRFCAETLGREIHHHPSKGGIAEGDKHRRWYADTLAMYRDVFDEDPPADIWPPVTLQRPVETSSPPNYFQPYRKNLHFLFLPFILPLLFGKLHPYALNGPQFLFFYALLLMAAAFVFLKVRKEKESLVEEEIKGAYLADANAFQLARYVYGRNKAIEAAVVDLVSKGILIAERNGNLVFYPSKLTAEELTENPLAQGLAATYKEDYLLTLKEVAEHYQNDHTWHGGLQCLYQDVVQKDWSRFFVLAFVVLVGSFRVQQGLANDRPVNYLTAMVAIGGLLLLFFTLALSASEIFKQAFNRRYSERQLALPQEQKLLAHFVFFGLTALAGSYAFANLESTFRRRGGGTASTDASNSGCGSSGCGSGCGGGCGGCGGGD